MSYEESLRSISLDADSSIGVYTGVPGLPGSAAPNYGKMYRLVKITGAHTVGLSTAGADTSIGVLQNKPQSTGSAATVAISGVSNVAAGAAFSAGAALESDSTGRAVTASTGKVVGYALAAATAANELVPMLIKVP